MRFGRTSHRGLEDTALCTRSKYCEGSHSFPSGKSGSTSSKSALSIARIDRFGSRS